MSHHSNSPNQTPTHVDELVVSVTTHENVPHPENQTPHTITNTPLEQQDPHPQPLDNKNNPIVTLQTHLSKPNTDSDHSFNQQTTKPVIPPPHLLPQNNSLQELKNLIQQALNNHEFELEKEKHVFYATPPEQKEEEVAIETKTEEEEGDKKEEELKETVVVASLDDDGAKTVEAIEESVVAVTSSVPDTEHAKPVTEKDEASLPLQPEQVSMYGIPLLVDERTDTILLKFLVARNFNVKEAFTMIKNTILWRKEFEIEKLMDEKLGDELEKVVYMHGFDKEGHPVCYNIYGEFQNKVMYKKCFSDEEKRENFLRQRVQFLEKSIRNLDFNNGGICTIVQVNDLADSPGLGKWELRQTTNQALQLLQDNYPEFVDKQVFINVPWWYLAVNRMISPFLTQRTKSKFVFAGPSKSTETLLSYIAPEQLPVKYGGLSKDGEFENSDSVTETTIKPTSKHTVEFPVTEKCLLSWEVRVIGWEIRYGAEFVPSNEGSYSVIVQKARKVASSEETVICKSFKIGEAGKVVLTIDNTSSRKKKLLYRFKTKSSISN